MKRRRSGRPHEATKINMIQEACFHVLVVAETYEYKARPKD